MIPGRRPGDRLTIGITFFVRKEASSIWGNGADQNCVFLLRLLRAAGHRVIAINGGDGDAPPPGMMFAGLGLEFVRTESVVDDLDVLIEAGAQVAAEHVARVRARGGRCVGYKFGNAYVIDTERAMHNLPSGSIFNGSQFDAIWTTPQHVPTCASYWETCYRCPVVVLPHIWEPLFVDAAIKEFSDGLTFGYQPGKPKKRIAIFEPNIGVVKACTIPMLVCERAYRRRPDLIAEVLVTNTTHMQQHQTFTSFAANLDMVRAKGADGKSLCSFEARYNTPWFLAKHADVVVAHQWENALNYAYYDALYGGYPLIHNSDMLPAGVGYRYHGFDVHDGGDVLAAALLTHDARALDYQRTASAFLRTVQATSPENIEAHERALRDLFAPGGG
jgi:hypothetical protein